jgi:hypothetical protein
MDSKRAHVVMILARASPIPRFVGTLNRELTRFGKGDPFPRNEVNSNWEARKDLPEKKNKGLLSAGCSATLQSEKSVVALISSSATTLGREMRPPLR